MTSDMSSSWVGGSKVKLNSPFHAAILVCVVAMLSYLAAKLGYALMLRPEMVWPLWPGCAFLVAVLLCTPRKIWPAILAAGLAGFAVNDVQTGLSSGSILLLISADAVEILVAALGVRYALGGVPRLNNVKRLAIYLLFAVVLAPISVASLGAIALGGNYWVMWRISFFTEALALLTVTPAILSWVDSVFTWKSKSAAYYLEAGVLFAGLVVLGYLTFVASSAINRSVLLYSLLPFLLWSALRLGITGIVTSVLVVDFLSIWGVVHGRGPFTGSTPLHNVMSLQLFLLFATIPFMVLAALVEERKEAAQALRSSEARERSKAKELETILDAVPVGVLIASDPKCQRITANRTGRELLRLPPRANASKSAPAGEEPKFRIMVDGVDVPAEELPIQRAAATAKQIFGVSEVAVFEDGVQRTLITNAAPLLGEDGQPYGAVAALLDVTEREQAEKALRESEERFRLVANTAPVLIWMCGPDKLCTYFNQPWLDFTGRKIEAELGYGWAEGVHEEDFKMCLDTYNQAFERREPFKIQYRLRRFDGEYRWILDTGVPRFTGDGSFAGYIGSAIDVTDRKLAEEALAGMGRKLIEAHEEERAWIARELHDDVNQRIALLAIKLEQLKKTLPDSMLEAAASIDGASEDLAEVGKDIQALSHRLHSSKLDYLGIVAAASSFCKELSQQQNVTVDFVHSDVPRTVPQEISLCLFRVLQEALQNASKHSGTRHFQVELRGGPEEISLMVHDSGVGLDVEAAANSPGLGLISMRERVGMVNGTIAIKSKASGGTTVDVRVPFRAKRSSQRAAG
jgi:PAS domain S-box-containing protein